MTLRQARPDDATALAELMIMADQAHYSSTGFALSLGGTREFQLDQLAGLARASARSGYHYSHFDVAENSGATAVASVAGFDRASADNQIEPALLEIGWAQHSISALFERIAGLGSCFPAEPPRTWTIEHVAVLPPYRGQSLAGQLLARVLARGAAGGFERAMVDVFEGNSAARRVYIKAGFNTVCTFGHAEFTRILGRDGLERLEMPLRIAS